jgi:hypothetical protein
MHDYTSRRDRYIFSQFSFAGSDNFSFLGPKGKAGLLWDYGVYAVTTTFAGATTTPMMSVGTAADADHYGDDFDFGALVADTSGGKSIRTTYAPTDAGFATYMLITDLPANTAVYGVLIAATGGGAAGVATAFVDVIWDL